MQLTRQHNRDEQAFPIGSFDPAQRRGPDGIRAGDLPDPRAVGTRRSAVRPEDEEKKAPAFEMRRVAKTIRVPSLKAPDGHGMPALLRAGKVVSAQHYDFEELRRLGVELVAVDAEIVPLQPVAAGGSGPTLAEVSGMLERIGMRIVPAEAPAQPVQAAAAAPAEVEQLRAQNEAMQAQLREQSAAIEEMRKAMAEMSKGRKER